MPPADLRRVAPSGRLASARNSLKHGLSGDGKCLPPDMQAELVDEIAMFSAAYRPQNPYESELIRRAALGNLRSRRLDTMEFAILDARTSDAQSRWDAQREDEVAALVKRLDAEPEEALRRLKRMAHGCDYLGDAWEDLGRVLDVNGYWDEAQARRALRLLGLDAEPTRASRESHRDLWVCVMAVRFEKKPDAVMKQYFAGADIAAVRAYLPAAAEARSRLAAFVRERVTEYETLGREIWENFEGPARADAPMLAELDPGPEAAKLRRYRADAERLRKRSLDELHRLRRESPAPAVAPTPTPARNELERPAPPAPKPPATAARNEPAPRRPAPSRNESPSRNEIAPTPPARPAVDRLERLMAVNAAVKGLTGIDLAIVPDRA
jgi:hypothetical protein